MLRRRHHARQLTQWVRFAVVGLLALAPGLAASAQPAPSRATAEQDPWRALAPATGTPPGAGSPVETDASPGNSTAVPRAVVDPAAAQNTPAQIKLVALLTADGQRIDKGIVWRVYEQKPPRDGKIKAISTMREATPVLKLPPGDYVVNASFGRAHLTRKISARPGAQSTEQFVLNAGGLRITALLGDAPAQPNAVTYSIYSDERDQQSQRETIMTGAKPGLIIRLNAGLYQIVSSYGDANAVVRAEVTVEAGKLTEATIAHKAARVGFKLVARPGGEALADTQWSIQTLDGEPVKESVGALPLHHLAPGNYAAIAKSGGKMFRRDFSVQSGDNVEVEIVVK